MAHHDHHAHGGRTHAAGEPFSAAEIERFHMEDRHAARAIVTLMLAVFSLGLIGSIAITIVVSGG
jgi:hypothetical protein